MLLILPWGGGRVGRYANWVRTMHDLQDTGCSTGTPDAHGNLSMSGYCWSHSRMLNTRGGSVNNIQ